jgi:hypothetical protein
LESGRIFWKKHGHEHWKLLDPREEPNKLCVDGFWNRSSGRPYDPRGFHLSLRCDLSCREKGELRNWAADPDPYLFHHRVIFFIFLITSLTYLLLMGVYGLIWTKQNVHGWTIFAFASTQFLYNFGRCLQSGWFAFGEPGSLIAYSFRPGCVTIGQFKSCHLFSIMLAWILDLI